MLKEVAADVRRDTRNAQRPQQLSDMSRLFYFANAPAAAAPAQVVEKSTPAPDRTLDVAYWNSAQVSNDCDSVRAYIQRFARSSISQGSPSVACARWCAA